MTTDNFENIDHRRSRAFTSGNAIPFLHATWNVAPVVEGYIEEVHRLDNRGVVVTEVVTGTSYEASTSSCARSAFSRSKATRFVASSYSTSQISTPRSRSSTN